jgi:folate-binding protein YgfZ
MLPRDPRWGSFFDLSNRTKLRLTGVDRVRFLNGQITNDVSKASKSSAIAACVLNAKGKLNAHIFVSVAADCIFIDGDASLHEALTARLDRYIIADDVQIEDVSGQFSLFHVLGGTKSDMPGRVVSADRFFLPGFDVWLDAKQHEQVKAALAAAHTFCDSACAEVLRIEQGVPTWGRELTEEIIPVEANLEQTCVDYNKGCYIGQEVISRMKMSRQRNKSLWGLISTGDAPLVSGMRLYPTGADKEIGWITSAISSDRLGKKIGLGYVKRPFDHAAAQLEAIDPANAAMAYERVQVTVVPTPFVIADAK